MNDGSSSYAAIGDLSTLHGAPNPASAFLSREMERGAFSDDTVCALPPPCRSSRTASRRASSRRGRLSTTWVGGWVNGVWNGCVVRFCLALHLDPRQLADLPSSATPWQALVGYIQPRVQHPKGTIPTVQLIASRGPALPNRRLPGQGQPPVLQ